MVKKETSRKTTKRHIPSTIDKMVSERDGEPREAEKYHTTCNTINRTDFTIVNHNNLIDLSFGREKKTHTTQRK